MSMVEIIGYLASFLVAVSLSMSSVLKLRWLNLLGAVTFSIYGFLIQSWPVCLVNAYIAVMDVYYLVQIYRTSELFQLFPLSGIHPDITGSFFRSYQRDIQKFFPSFTFPPAEDTHLYTLFRNFKMIGLFGYRQNSSGEAEIIIDYVTKEYRDLKPGNFLFHQQASEFGKQGIRCFISSSHHKEHTRYLKRLGFEPASDGRFRKKLQ